MNGNDIKRLSRLTAILTQLQAGRLVSATSLAKKFSVSIRTIYRDIRALEQAGVPIVTEEGKGYMLMEGYRLPPVMFTENEANALITAELIIEASKDESLIREFNSAIQKVKAGLTGYLKNRAETLQSKLAIARTYLDTNIKSSHLLDIQKALLEFRVVKINYTSKTNESSTREVEPFVIYSNEKDEWVLIAYCRLRKDFRSFLLNRIEYLMLMNENFDPHPMTFKQYRKKFYGDE